MPQLLCTLPRLTPWRLISSLDPDTSHCTFLNMNLENLSIPSVQDRCANALRTIHGDDPVSMDAPTRLWEAEVNNWHTYIKR